MPTIRATFFDFDGTLVDSYDAIAASVNHVRQTYGLPPLSVAEVKRHVGRGPAYLFAHTCHGCNVDEAVTRYRAHHPSVMYSETRLLPGALETIEALHAAGVRLGICSNKPRGFTQKLVDHLGIARFFDVVLGPEDVRNIKPAPDMLVAGLERLGVAAEEALYVGDMTVDIGTARAAGVIVWIVPTGSDSRADIDAARPDRVLEGLASIPAALGII
jgi:2-phosphoglycolate phosphatase